MGGFVYPGLDPGRLAEVGLLVGSPAAFFAVIQCVLDDLTHPIELLLDHDLAKVIFFMAIAAAFAAVDILTHVFLLEGLLILAK